MATLDGAGAIDLGFPHDFITASHGLTYGAVGSLIDRHLP